MTSAVRCLESAYRKRAANTSSHRQVGVILYDISGGIEQTDKVARVCSWGELPVYKEPLHNPAIQPNTDSI
jgi:hypothetical protein